MEEVESVAYLGGVKSRLFLMQTTLPLHVEHEITAVDKLYDEEQSATPHSHSVSAMRQTDRATSLSPRLPL